MEYRLGVGEGPETIPGGTGILLLHPSTAETDRIDTDFLRDDTDRFLVISTRTTADEVEQKLEFYGISTRHADIIDAISVERGYSRRQSDRVSYLAAPDDVDGLIQTVEEFLREASGKIRLSLDSITELCYYAGERRAFEAVERILSLLDGHDAVGIFHLAIGVHDEAVIDAYRALFDVIVELDEDGAISVDG